MQKLNIENLIIETTRRCNLHCNHCLRGKQQPRDISYQTLNLLCKQINNIGTITFTGGEPSLLPDKIAFFTKLALYNKVSIENFYVVTNGVIHHGTIDFMIELIRLWQYCTDNECSGISISNSQFHQWALEEEIDYEKHPLRVLRFCTLRGEFKHLEDGRGTPLLGEGRAMYSGFTCKPAPEEELILTRYDDDVNIGGDLYINALGEIVKGCDWSYESQEERVIGKIGTHESPLIEILKNNSKIDE